MKEHYTKDDYSYTRLVEDGKQELADKYLDYLNKGVDIENAFWEKVTSQKVIGELFNIINEKCGLKLHYSFTTKDSHGEDCIKYESVENLAEIDPILNLAWKEFKVVSFNAGKVQLKEFGVEGAKEQSYFHTFKPEDIDYSKPQKPSLWLDIHYYYHHQDGGRNGAKIGNCWYDGEKWNVELLKDKPKRDW